MKLKNKLFPYPVLSEDSGGYAFGKFSAEISPIKDGDDLRVDVAATLECATLTQHINDGAAIFAYHIECAQTGFRKIEKTAKAEHSFYLSSRDVNGAIDICPLIVAEKDIPKFFGNDFHSDYDGIRSFMIERGYVMATGTPVSFFVEKEADEFADMSSIFLVCGNADEKCRQMLICMSEQKLVVKLPHQDFSAYKLLLKVAKEDPRQADMLNALTITPALAWVLEKLKNTAKNREAHEDLRWYRALSSSVEKCIRHGIDNDEFSECDTLELAQKLINNPLSTSLRILTDGTETS